jgi:hypothetical protein
MAMTFLASKPADGVVVLFVVIGIEIPMAVDSI